MPREQAALDPGEVTASLHHASDRAPRAAQPPHRPGRTRSRARTGRLAPAAARSPAPARGRRRARPGRRPAPPSARSRGSRAAGRSQSPSATYGGLLTITSNGPAQTLAPAPLPEVCPRRQAKPLGIAPRDRERRGAVVDAEPGRARQLGQQRQQQTTRADAQVEDAQRAAADRAAAPAPPRRPSRSRGAGSGPPDRPRSAGSRTPSRQGGRRPARARAGAVPAHRARASCAALSVSRPPAMSAARSTPGRGSQQQPGLRARALDARRGEPRGNLSGQITRASCCPSVRRAEYATVDSHGAQATSGGCQHSTESWP